MRMNRDYLFRFSHPSVRITFQAEGARFVATIYLFNCVKRTISSFGCQDLSWEKQDTGCFLLIEERVTFSLSVFENRNYEFIADLSRSD